MRIITICLLCVLFMASGCKKEDTPPVTRIRFENQSDWSFTNVTVVPWDKSAVSIGDLPIGKTSDYVVCDTLYKQTGIPKFGALNYNVTYLERRTLLQPGRPYPVNYERVEPGDYTIVIKSFLFPGTTEPFPVFSFK